MGAPRSSMKAKPELKQIILDMFLTFLLFHFTMYHYNLLDQEEQGESRRLGVGLGGKADLKKTICLKDFVSTIVLHQQVALGKSLNYLDLIYSIPKWRWGQMSHCIGIYLNNSSPRSFSSV